jgi:hypothetical protein
MEMEQIRFGALKVSRGNLDKLRSAVEVAKIDWRDLLASAGFAWRADAYKHWLPGQPRSSVWRRLSSLFK